jgi:hypothetical protein
MLSTVDEIIDAVGGTAAAAGICGVGLSAVSNWRSRGRIPSEKFMIFADALKRLGKKASPSLFGFETAEARL